VPSIPFGLSELFARLSPPAAEVASERGKAELPNGLSAKPSGKGEVEYIEHDYR